MTRKQALYKALEIIAETKLDDILKEKLITKIKEIVNELPFTSWSEQTIHDTLAQFSIENNRNPTVTDLKKKGLPPHPVIEHRFKMNSSEFLKKYYPQDKPKCNSIKFGNKTEEEWLNIFIQEYYNIKPSSSNIFNSNRKKDIPTWQTIAIICGVERWNELLKISNVKRFKNNRIKNRPKTSFTIQRYIDLETQLIKLNY